jgi:N-acyl-D-aspartate/D-glutamate deacylase
VKERLEPRAENRSASVGRPLISGGSSSSLAKRFPVPHSLRRLLIAIVSFLVLDPQIALPAPDRDALDSEPRFDLVIQGGRVMDPASGLDALRDVGIKDARIVAISETPLEGAQMLDARGRVVTPGFIDLHTHSPNPLGQRYQLLDGVTTALELEAGAGSLDGLEEALGGRARIHYGASVAWGSARLEALLGIRQAHLLSGRPRPIGWRGAWTVLRLLMGGSAEAVFTRRADPEERGRMRALIEAGLDAGGFGIGLPLDYFSEAVDDDELRMVFEIAADRDTIVFAHVRRGVNGDPSGLREALQMARETGAALHVCHITHNAMRNVDLFLDEIRAARAEGIDVTTEILPYNAGSAPISSAVFGRDWRTIFDIDYSDVEWAATGMRFDEATWAEYREKFPEGPVVHHYLKEEWTRRALAEPGVIVVSDLLPMLDESILVAPHNGAFSRVLGRYVREAGVLDLQTALARMTAEPADRLAVFYPLFARKGRVQVGADADLTVFDPTTILDRATYGDPFQPSAGIEHVVVAGRIAVRDGVLAEDIYAGELLRAQGPNE